MAIRYRTADVDGFKVFYREAGPADAPKLLLLHGFPSAGHMFRDLIPLLADRFHIVAPDLPGFGQSDMPPRETFSYTFDNIARVIERFTELIGFDRFAVYVFDYGAPTGFRLALRHPERITAIITQNGNAYEEGLSEGWSPIKAYWQDPSQTNRKALRAFLTPETTHWQYTHGVPDPTMVSPDGQNLDNFYLARPGADEIQLDLFGDYKSNVALHPSLRGYFRKHKPPFLAVWDKNDPFFLPGAEATPEREDCTIVAWYRSIYAPRAGGAYDSHHRTAGIAGRTRRRRCRVAARGAVSITNKNLIFGTHRP